jgi:hypothetical protein
VPGRAAKAIVQLAKLRRGLILIDIPNERHGFILPEREAVTTGPPGPAAPLGSGFTSCCLHPSVKASILTSVDGRQEAG